MAAFNIRVNAVGPGVIETDMTSPLFEVPFYKKMIENIPMKRVGQVEVATAVVYLCSDKASFITGQCFVIDGGSLVR